MHNEETRNAQPKTANELIEAITHTSRKHLTTRDLAINNSYSSPETWALAKLNHESTYNNQTIANQCRR